MAEDRVTRFKVVVIGGSAGSLHLILKLVLHAPVNSNVTFILVAHRKNEPTSFFQTLIASRTAMPVKEVEDKDLLSPNIIYIAPPDYHLLIDDEHTFSLDSSEKVHYSRPSIDVTFESVADVFGSAVVGVLLSGANADGAAGLQKIRQRGGFTIVQDPATAEVDFMPQQALNAGVVDKVIAAQALPLYLHQLLTTSTIEG